MYILLGRLLGFYVQSLVRCLRFWGWFICTYFVWSVAWFCGMGSIYTDFSDVVALEDSSHAQSVFSQLSNFWQSKPLCFVCPLGWLLIVVVFHSCMHSSSRSRRTLCVSTHSLWSASLTESRSMLVARHFVFTTIVQCQWQIWAGVIFRTDENVYMHSIRLSAEDRNCLKGR